MSKYKKIATQIRNPESLVQALNDLGLRPEVAPDVHQNTLTLKTHWSSYGGKNNDVAVAISKETLRDVVPNQGFMDGIGFTWNGSEYDMVVDHYDEGKDLVRHINQRYARNEVARQAFLMGYTLTEDVQPDGSIQLICTQY